MSSKKLTKKIIIAVGGSGGHIYPSQAIADRLIEDGCEVVFMGGGLAKNPFFDSKRYDTQPLPAVAWQGMNWVKNFQGAIQLGRSFFTARRFMNVFKPDVVLGFGTVHSLPVILAAKWASIPVVLHEQNCIPGKVNRWLSPYVTLTGVHFDETKALLKGNVKSVGMPLRQGISQDLVNKGEALHYFGLEKGVFTFLVFGGSQGAHWINQEVPEALKIVSEQRAIQVIHLTGGRTDSSMCYPYASSACVKPFETRMDLAWSIADMAITRAGAASLAEQWEFEVPGVLIPYPYAEQHQDYNADAFIAKTGGGVKVSQNGLSKEGLAEAVLAMMVEIGKYKRALKESKKFSNRDAFYHLIKQELL